MIDLGSGNATILLGDHSTATWTVFAPDLNAFLLYTPEYGLFRHNEIVLFGGRVQTPGGSDVDIDATSRIAFSAATLRHQPTDIVTPAGSPLTLHLIPTTSAHVTNVQWYRNNTYVTSTSSTILPLGAASPEHSGEWKAILSGACGGVFSETFQVTVTNAPVTCPGDSDGDGVITFVDLNAVLSTYGQACPD